LKQEKYAKEVQDLLTNKTLYIEFPKFGEVIFEKVLSFLNSLRGFFEKGFIRMNVGKKIRFWKLHILRISH